MFMPRAIADAINKVARQSVGKDWVLYVALLDHWQEIVGLEYARVTAPVKITFPHQPHEPRRCKGTLCVRLPKGLAMEFTFKTEQMRQRINGYFGYDAVAKIIFDPVYNMSPARAAPSPEPDPETLAAIRAGAKTVENEELQQALESFGSAIMNYSP
jgi:hypothetical protein